MNIEEAYTLAKDALTPLGIPLWYDRVGKETAAYILITCIYSRPSQYASNRPHGEYHYFFVYYYALAEKRDSVTPAMRQIRKALEDVGFLAQDQNKPTGEEANAKYFGKYSEFSIEKYGRM